MADRSYTYRVIVDTSSARTQAQQLRAVFENELRSIQAQNVQLINPQSLQQIAQTIQQQVDHGQKSVQALQQVSQSSANAATQAATAQTQAASAQAAAAQTAQSAAQNAAQSAKQATEAARQTRQQGQGIGSFALGLTGTQGLVGGLAGGLAAGLLARHLASATVDMVKTTAQAERLRAAFDNLTQTAGLSGDAVLAAMQKASKGAISDTSLIQSANRAILLQVADTADEMASILEVATARGKAMGLSAEQAFNDIVTGIGRMSPLILDNLGILTGGEKTFQDYAASVGKTAAQLTDAEKKQVLFNKVVSESQALIQGSSASGDDLASKFERMDAAISNAKVALGELFAPAVAVIAQKLAESTIALTDALVTTNVEGSQSTLMSLGPAIGDLAKRIENLQAITETAPLVGDTKSADEARAKVEQLSAQIESYGNIYNRAAKVTGAPLLDIDQLKKGTVAFADAKTAIEGAAEAADQAAKVSFASFGSTLDGIGTAISQLGDVKFARIEGVAEWRKELAELRSELLRNGSLTDEQMARYEQLAQATTAIVSPSSALRQVLQSQGSAFLENNDEAAGYVQQILDLNEALANGLPTEQYAAGLEKIRTGLRATADAAQFDLNAALTRSTQSIAQLDQLIASGTPGLDAWREELPAIRDDIIATGTVTEEQALRIKTLSQAINEASTSQADYGSSVRSLGDAFLSTNDRAREITEQLNNLKAQEDAHIISTETYTALANSLRNELDNLAINQTNISTEGLDQLGQAIGDLETAVARGLPGADALIQQAIAMEQAIAASGGIVTADQAAQIDAWAAAADSAAISAEILASVQNAVGIEAATNDGIIAGLLSSMANLTGEYNNGAISGDIFAGAMNVLTARLYELLIAAGLTREEVDKLVASLGNIPNADLGSAGGVLGQRLGTTISQSLQAQEESRKRREAERLAKIQESAAKKAATEMENAMKRAAQEFENALKKIPGLFGRSQVTEGQLKLAKAGLPQNFADDFLRRLEDEIKNGVDWPDVSVEQANEALRRIGVQVTDDAQITFQQISEAWESGLLFSDKINLELINAEAVKAALELQKKMEEGQQNIIDHFKNVIGIAVDAATGTSTTTAAGGTAKAATGANVPQTVEVVAPDEVQQVLTSGSITITSATLSAVAMQDLATKLATQSFAIQISSVTISATATATLSEQMLKDMAGLKEDLESALMPVVKPGVVLLREDYTVERDLLALFLKPDVTPNIKLDAADLLNAVDTLQALTPNIHPVLSLTEEGKTTFVADVEKLSPSVKARLSYGGATELSDFSVAISDNVPSPGIATTLYTTIEEIQLFRDLVEATVKPKVTVALTLAEETTDEQGNVVSSLPDFAGQFSSAIDTQIKDNAESFTQQGKDIAGYIALAAYNYGFPDITARYADLIDLQIVANAERFGTTGAAFADAIASGATTYVFPDVALQFVEAIEVQVRTNQERFMRQGTNAMSLITQGMNGFDFSFIATAMISGVRAGMEQEAIKTALGDVGAGAMRTIRDGLESEAGNISWAGILTAAITENVLTELADSLEGQ